MKVGTKSVLFGAHCFFLHPWFLVYAWWKLYGWEEIDDYHIGKVSLKDPRLWLAFFLHDLGYLGKSDMDGEEEGEQHPRFAARIMSELFDRDYRIESYNTGDIWYRTKDGGIFRNRLTTYGPWGNFCLYHSRFLAARAGEKYSRLCVADKLAVSYEPWWLYIPRATLSGEIKEYMADGEAGAEGKGKYAGEQHCKKYKNKREWFREVKQVMRTWALEHKDGKKDQVTLAGANDV